MKKKICFLMDSIFSYGGVQRVTAVIAKELAKYYDVTIVTFDRPEQKDTSLYDLCEADFNYRFFNYPKTPNTPKNRSSPGSEGLFFITYYIQLGRTDIPKAFTGAAIYKSLPHC